MSGAKNIPSNIHSRDSQGRNQQAFEVNFVQQFKMLQNLVTRIHNRMKNDEKQKKRALGNNPQPLPSEWKELEVMALNMKQKLRGGVINCIIIQNFTFYIDFVNH